MSEKPCTPKCDYWRFGQDPPCNTAAVGECRRYNRPTEKFGSCPPKAYSDHNPFRIIKRVFGLEEKVK